MDKALAELIRISKATGKELDLVSVEYHLLSWRELYDKPILTADRHSSSAGEWVI